MEFINLYPQEIALLASPDRRIITIFTWVYIAQIPLSLAIAYLLATTVGRDIYKLISLWFVFSGVECLWRIQALQDFKSLPLSLGRFSVLVVAIFQLTISIFIIAIALREHRFFKRASRRKNAARY